MSSRFRRGAVRLVADYGPYRNGEAITGKIYTDTHGGTPYLLIDASQRRDGFLYLAMEDELELHIILDPFAEPKYGRVWKELSPLEMLAIQSDSGDGSAAP